jgi:hypothetical protein
MQETVASSREVLTTELAGRTKALVMRGTLLGSKRRVDGQVQGTAPLQQPSSPRRLDQRFKRRSIHRSGSEPNLKRRPVMFSGRIRT